MPYPYIVDDLFPRRRTSLICGPSGAGKSRWLLPVIADWLEGKPILGKQSHPDTCAYISCDRPSDATFELIELMGLEQRLKEMPIYSLMDKGRDFDFAKIFPMVGTKPRVLWIEAFQVLVPKGEINHYWPVMDFFRQWHQTCSTNDKTPVGSCHTPKTRDNEGYSIHRDKIMGTAAWGAGAEGIITLEFAQPGNIDSSERSMTVLPRHGKPWSLTFDFDNRGWLIPAQDETPIMVEMMMEQHLTDLPPGTILTTKQLETWAKSHKISRATLFRWIEDCTYLSRAKPGIYVYNPNPTDKTMQ